MKNIIKSFCTALCISLLFSQANEVMGSSFMNGLLNAGKAVAKNAVTAGVATLTNPMAYSGATNGMSPMMGGMGMNPMMGGMGMNPMMGGMGMNPMMGGMGTNPMMGGYGMNQGMGGYGMNQGMVTNPMVNPQQIAAIVQNVMPQMMAVMSALSSITQLLGINPMMYQNQLPQLGY